MPPLRLNSFWLERQEDDMLDIMLKAISRMSRGFSLEFYTMSSRMSTIPLSAKSFLKKS